MVRGRCFCPVSGGVLFHQELGIEVHECFSGIRKAYSAMYGHACDMFAKIMADWLLL